VGQDYRIATAELRPSNDVGVPVAAEIKPIISPQGGHGSNVNNELNARYVGIAASFGGNSVPLIANNDFRTIGVLRDPRFANVVIQINSETVVGSFVNGESILRYRPLHLSGNVNIYANSLVIGTNTSFNDSLRTNDRLLITDGATNILANVVSIIDNERMIIDKEDPEILSNCNLYFIQSGQYFAEITEFDLGRLTLTNVNPTGWGVSSYLIGTESATTAQIADTPVNITIGNRDSDSFGAFNQLTTLVGTFTSPTRFIQDEVITQSGNTDITAVLHSSRDNPGINNDFLYVSTVSDSLTLGNVIGITSNAYFEVRDKYPGELVRDSGEILYLENTNPISRNPRQTENIRLILEF
jgi:hypothetical protein